MSLSEVNVSDASCVPVEAAPTAESSVSNVLPATLLLFLKQRAAYCNRHFLRAIGDVSEAEAALDRNPHWPDHRWGIGQDGSMAGIVYHVAAWKEMTLPLLTPGDQSISREELEARSLPPVADWQGVCNWYVHVSARWQETIDRMPDSLFSEMIVWEGQPWAIGAIIAEIIEHDVQHASQIDYLRQRHKAQRLTV